MGVKVSTKNGLSLITESILEDVQKEAETIILSAQKEAQETLRVAKEEAENNYQTMLNQAAVRIESEKRKIASVTEVEMRNRLLQTKEELFDAAFEKARVRLQEFVSAEEYRNIISKQIAEAAKSIGQKVLVIQVNANDKTWLESALSGLAKKMRCELKLSDQTIEIIGGFKIQTEDGIITYDNTIDNRLNELKPVLRVEVAKILFGEV